MTNVYFNSFSLIKTASSCKRNLDHIIDWMGHRFSVLPHFFLHINVPYTTTLFITANTIYFAVINIFAHSIDKRVEECPKKLSPMEKGFNQILISFGIVGGSSLIFNIAFSKLIHYSLNKITLIIITTTTIASRLLLTTFLKYFNEEEIQVEKRKFSLPIEPNRKAETNELTNIKQTTKNLKLQESLFIKKLCSEVEMCLLKELIPNKLSPEQQQQRKLFLEQMREGIAVIEHQQNMCQAVCLSIQASFEHILASKLRSGEIEKVDVLFLDELPCAPLRHNEQSIPINKQEEWKTEIFTKRVETIRKLRDAGANLFISYSNPRYQALSIEYQETKAEFEIYEKEKLQPNIEDFPLPIDTIPQEVRGTLYMFTDKAGNHYQLITQNTQIEQTDQTSKECWKKWLGVIGNHPEADSRSLEIVNFVRKYQGQKFLLGQKT